MSLLLADFVAKVENRTTLKISRKLIFRRLCCCLAIKHRYEGPWSILDESIWSLTSPRVKRISGSKKFRSSPQKDFFNTICQRATSTRSRSVRSGGRDRKLKESTLRFARDRPQPPPVGFD